MANALLYGFQTLSEDLLNRRATEVPEAQAAITMSLAAHNAAVNRLISVFAERTTGYTGRFTNNGAGVLQPLDEFGRSVPPKLSQYSVGWPIQMGGGATGMTWLVEPRITVQELNDLLTTLFMQDLRWVRRKIIGALVDNTASGVTFTDPVFGDITVYGLANADAAPLYYKQYSDSFATDTHYFAEADAIADGSNPFALLRSEILEHPENSGQIVNLIPTGLTATATALTEFVGVTDPNIRPADSAVQLVAGFPSLVPSDAIPLGYLKTSQSFLAEWGPLPTGMIITYATQGPRPLKMREDVVPQFQGFFPKDRKDEFPWMGEQWVRRAGFGGNNRTGATVYYKGTSDTYAIPSGYGILMAS